MLGNVWVWNWTNQAWHEARPRAGRTARAPSPDELGVARNEPISMQGGCYPARLSHAYLVSKKILHAPPRPIRHHIGVRAQLENLKPNAQPIGP
jgi:hypothetical protein